MRKIYPKKCLITYSKLENKITCTLEIFADSMFILGKLNGDFIIDIEDHLDSTQCK